MVVGPAAALPVAHGPEAGVREPSGAGIAGPPRRRRRLDDADVSTRRISDQLGHANASMTQDRYLGRRLTDQVTADVLEGLFGTGESAY